MKYEVIARKFRPQLFEEVVGQSPIVQTLKNAIELDRIGHAYLFCGPRGVGKTTTARLLAKALNCIQGPTPTPCNRCPSCQEISIGRSIDVLEIDAASNTGVDSIRELRDNARYAPSRDRYKIFIVDEVHMLSVSAFNALLKILEEPPKHIAFILATTERHKLPATVLSRCQQFVFRTIPPVETRNHLRKIAQDEGVTIGDGALDYVVKAAEGSMRDAQSLLDQIIAFGGQKISEEDVRNVLGFIPSDLLDRAVTGLIERNSRSLLDVVELVADQGLNLQQFVKEFLSRIRDMLLVKLGISERVLAGSDERARIGAHAEQFSEQDLIRFFDFLLALENDLRWTSEPRFHLEIGCIKLAKIGQLRDIEAVIRELNPRSETPKLPSHEQGKATDRPARPAIPEGSKVVPSNNKASELDKGQPSSRAQAPEKPAMAAAVLSFPKRYRGSIQATSPTTAMYLDRATSIDQEEERVQIRVPNATVRAALASSEHINVLEKAASEILGKPASVLLTLAEPMQPKTTAGPDNPLRESAEKEALVQSFLDVFRGEITQVKSAEKPD